MDATPALTIDRMLGGRFVVVQPRTGGHRVGTDAILLAAALPSAFSGVVADFGAGCGAAGLAVLARCPDAAALLIERDPSALDLARATLAHADNAGLAQRARLIAADVTLKGNARREAGLGDACADVVIMNPPFNAPADRASPHAGRRAAHVLEDGLFQAWIRSAAALLTPKGRLALIARPSSLRTILTALEPRFGATELLPVIANPGQPAIRIVLRATLASRAGLSLLPPLTLHGPGGGFSPEAAAIHAGEASLFGDERAGRANRPLVAGGQRT